LTIFSLCDIWFWFHNRVGSKGSCRW